MSVVESNARDSLTTMGVLLVVTILVQAVNSLGEIKKYLSAPPPTPCNTKDGNIDPDSGGCDAGSQKKGNDGHNRDQIIDRYSTVMF